MNAICEEPGCVALAGEGGRCAIHGRPVTEDQGGGADDVDPDVILQQGLAYARRRNPRLIACYLLGVERVPLPMPALLDFHFYSPEGRVLVSADLEGRQLWNVLWHQLAHLAQQVRRFRRRTGRGLYPPVGIGGESAYFPWGDVAMALESCSAELPYGHRDTLAAASPACARCGQPPARLTWAYFTSPQETWCGLAGRAGWLALCLKCHEQVAFFQDRCN